MTAPPIVPSKPLFVSRDADGQIVSVRNQPDAQHTEAHALTHPELQDYLQLPANNSDDLNTSDADLVRVIDDLIDVLISKQLISFTDLPPAAQGKLLLRRRLRDELPGNTLIDTGDHPI